MALTKEDLQRISLPLSAKDYLMLHKEELENKNFWKGASRKLKEEYENLMMTYYDRHFPGNDTSALEIPWTPPID